MIIRHSKRRILKHFNVPSGLKVEPLPLTQMDTLWQLAEIESIFQRVVLTLIMVIMAKYIHDKRAGRWRRQVFQNPRESLKSDLSKSVIAHRIANQAKWNTG